MQLLKWLRQEGALPRDLAYPLEDAEESLADFSRLQRVLKEHPTLEDVVLGRHRLPGWASVSGTPCRDQPEAVWR